MQMEEILLFQRLIARLEENTKMNEKESILPISQSTILGNSHQEKSSPHWGSESENGSIRDEPMQDTLPLSSSRETQNVEDNASQEDNAGFSKCCDGETHCHLRTKISSGEPHCSMCNSILTVSCGYCEKCKRCATPTVN